MPGLLYADDLVICGESGKELRVMVRWFAEVCRKKEENLKLVKINVIYGNLFKIITIRPTLL